MRQMWMLKYEVSCSGVAGLLFGPLGMWTIYEIYDHFMQNIWMRYFLQLINAVGGLWKVLNYES